MTLIFINLSINQYPPGHGATEVIDENLSENDGEENLKKMKEADQIIDDKYKNMDNKLREEREAEIMLDRNDGEEKHLAEQKMKEKVEDKENEQKIVEKDKEDKPTDIHEDLAKLDTQLKGILKTSDSKQNLKEMESGVTKTVLENVIKQEGKNSQTAMPSASKQDCAISKPSRTLPHIDQFESAVNKTGGIINLGQKINGKDGEETAVSVGSVENAQPKAHSVKQLVRNFEKVGREKDVFEMHKAFSVPENMSEKDKQFISGVVPRRQSEPSCNIVENSFPEHLISRAQLTFAIMQTDDRTQTMGDDNIDENATRAAPFTQASQWQGVSGFASSTDNSDNEEDGCEEVIGADGKVHKSTTKSKNRSFLHTLADEDDLKLDSMARNSVYYDNDNSKLMRNSLIFIDDDIEESPQEQLNIFIKDKIEERSLGLESKDVSFSVIGSERSRGGKVEKYSNEDSAIISSQASVNPMIPHAFSVPSQLSEKYSDSFSDKFTKDLGNRINIPSKIPTSPSKSSLKDKESLSEIKKLAVLNNLKLSSFGKLSGSKLRKERSSDNLDKIAKDKKFDINNVNGSPSKTRHLLKPIDSLLKEKTKSDGDIAGSERRSRSRSREGRERGRSNSRSEDKTKRRQSLSTIDEHIRTRGVVPLVSPLAEKTLNNDHTVPSSNSGSQQNNAIIASINIDNRDNRKHEENKNPEEKERRERKSKRRANSASRIEKNENTKNAEQQLLAPVPPLDLNNQKVPKPPCQGTAPKKNLVYSAR